MISTQRKTTETIHCHEMDDVSCPVCGARMNRANVSCDIGSREFDWFECSQKNCPGWLVRTPNFVPEFSA